MTQHQLINQLQDIMPEIVETKNPRAVMLKAAKKNNLSIAQLEKLGHVYNTCKTLIGLEKQAHRGDSFSIVDVPGMVAEYSSYTPGEPTTKKQQDVHSQINAWMNETDSSAKAAALEWAECFTPMGKSAATKKLPSVHSMLQEYFKTDGGFSFHNAEEGRQWEEEDLEYLNKPEVLHKAASFAKETDGHQADRLYKEACEACEEVMYNASESARRICYEITSEMRSGDLNWKDVAYDLHDKFQEKAAAAVGVIEDFFKQANYRTEHVALEKRGFTRAIPADRYGMYEKVAALLHAMDTHEKAFETLVDLRADKAAEQEKKANTIKKEVAALSKDIGRTADRTVRMGLESIPDWNKVPGVVEDLTQVTPGLSDAINEDKIRDKAKSDVKLTGALQQLILSDPVIQQADQADVEDLYNTISDLAPNIAKDPISVAPVLKEALQYGSLPIQQVKDLLAAEKDYQSIRKNRAEADKLNA